MKSLKLKTTIFALLLSLLLIPTGVNAQTYYTNQNGIEMNEEEYKYFSDNFEESFMKYMTEELYEIHKANINLEIVDQETTYVKSEVKIDNYGNVLDSRESVVTEDEYENFSGNTMKLRASCGTGCWETAMKKLTITYYNLGSGKYKISSTLKYKTMPQVRSTDVYGTRFTNFFKTEGTENMYMLYSANMNNGYSTRPLQKYVPNYKNWTRSGWAGLFTLPGNIDYPNDSKTVIEFYMDFQGTKIDTSKTANIYVSYQHSQEYLTMLNVYNNLSLVAGGHGNVFGFGSYASNYDAMTGVSVAF